MGQVQSYFESFANVGVDYLTCTTSQLSSSNAVTDLWRRASREVERQGNKIVPWAGHGYHGLRVGQMQWGARPDGCIITLSGDYARFNWWDYYQLCDNVSRVDLQVTARLTSDPQLQVLKHERQASRFWKGRNDGPTIAITRDNRKGATLYLGKLTSRLMFRIYNKAAQSKSKDYERCVRYEGLFRDVFARRVIADMVESGSTQDYVRNLVNQMLRDRGVVPVFPANGVSFFRNVRKIDADVDRKLRWLNDSVRPSVRFLLDHGRIDDVLDVLGLREMVRPESPRVKPTE